MADASDFVFDLTYPVDKFLEHILNAGQCRLDAPIGVVLFGAQLLEAFSDMRIDGRFGNPFGNRDRLQRLAGSIEFTKQFADHVHQRQIGIRRRLKRAEPIPNFRNVRQEFAVVRRARAPLRFETLRKTVDGLFDEP